MDTNPSNIIWICFSANACCSAHEVLFMQAEACIPRFATLLCLLLCAQWMSTFGICGFPANTIRCSSGQVRSEYVRPYWNACVLAVSPNYSKCLSWVKGRWFWILQNATRSPREFEFSRLPFLWNSSAQTAAFLLFLELLLVMMMMMRHRQMRTVGGLRAGCGKWARQDCGLMIKPAAEAHPVKWQEDNETGQGDRQSQIFIMHRPATVHRVEPEYYGCSQNHHGGRKLSTFWDMTRPVCLPGHHASGQIQNRPAHHNRWNGDSVWVFSGLLQIRPQLPLYSQRTNDIVKQINFYSLVDIYFAFP